MTTIANAIELYKRAVEIEQKIFPKLSKLQQHGIFLGKLFQHSLAVDLGHAMQHPSNFVLKHRAFWAALQSRDALFRRLSRHTRSFHHPSHAPVLFFLNSISHVRTMLPVLKEMAQQKSKFLAVANGYRVQKSLSAEKIPHISLDTYPMQTLPRAELLDVLSRLHLPQSEVSDEIMRYLLKFHALRASRLLSAAASMLEEERPRLLVLNNITDTMGKCMIAAASSKTKSLYVQHGMMLKHPSYQALDADYMAAWGQNAKQFMTALGTRPEQIIVTGSPQYDKLAHFRPDCAAVRNELHIPSGKRFVVYTSQPHGFELTLENNKAIISTLLKTMKQYPDYPFVIKLHPAERQKFYRQELKQAGKQVQVTRDANTLQLMGCAEAVITQISTTAVEAMQLGKKVLSINPTGQKDIMPYEKAKAALCVDSLQKVPGAVQQLLEGSDVFRNARQNFIKQYNAGVDGNATTRVIALVKRLSR